MNNECKTSVQVFCGVFLIHTPGAQSHSLCLWYPSSSVYLSVKEDLSLAQGHLRTFSPCKRTQDLTPATATLPTKRKPYTTFSNSFGKESRTSSVPSFLSPKSWKTANFWTNSLKTAATFFKKKKFQPLPLRHFAPGSSHRELGHGKAITTTQGDLPGPGAALLWSSPKIDDQTKNKKKPTTSKNILSMIFFYNLF